MAAPDQNERRTELFKRLQVGDAVAGTISGMTSYGAFVQIGDGPGPHLWGDGLIHVPELSWRPVRRAADVVQLGQRVMVEVIRLNRERNQIMLSLRQASEHEQAGDTFAWRARGKGSFLAARALPRR